MAGSHTPADDIIYDLISVQYHALKGGQVYEQFAQDAKDHDDVAQFIRQIQEEDAHRAERAHELIAALTAERGGIG
jgi:hypothetical protein